MTRFLFALLLASHALATDAIPLPGVKPIGLAVSSDGMLWFAAQWNVVGRVRPDGVVQQISLPSPFAIEKRAAMHAMPDGSMLVGSYNGVFAWIDANLGVRLFETGDRYEGVLDFADAGDGTIRLLIDRFGVSSLGRFHPDLTLTRHPLPSRTFAIAAAPDGTLYTLSGDVIRRDGTDVVASCAYCGTTWLEVTSDGTIWFPRGRIAPDGALHLYEYNGSAATIGPDGAVWVAAEWNAILRLNDDGSYRTLPFADTRQIPSDIVSFQGALWYGVQDAVRRIEPDTVIDVHLRHGDVVAIEQEALCCVGVPLPIPTLAFHRRGAHSFVRRIPGRERRSIGGAGVYAVDPTTVVVLDAGDTAATVLDGNGTVRHALDGEVVGSGPGAGMVVGRDGTVHMLRGSDSGYRLVSIDAAAEILRDVPLPIDDIRVRAIDLAADQCTLFYVGARPTDDVVPHGRVGKIDICNGTVGTPIANDLEEEAIDLRVLPGGELLVLALSSLTRYDPSGKVLRVLATPGPHSLSIALDVDARSVWIGASDLRRIDLATGQTIEVLPTYGPVTSISVVGEPRAARVRPVRRRAARP